MALTRLLERDLVAVTEQAAIAAAQTMGYGDARRSTEVASVAVHQALDELEVAARVMIGEGEPGEVPRLFTGEEVGQRKGDEEAIYMDLAVLPLESASLCATGAPGSISALVAADSGGLLRVPPAALMEKFVVGPTARGVIHLDAPVPENLRNIAQAFGREVTDLTVVVINHQRHRQLIGDIRSAGARVRLVSGGELSSAISAAVRGTGIHAVVGTGEAALATFIAAAMRCLGGEIQARVVTAGGRERAEAKKAGGKKAPAEAKSRDGKTAAFDPQRIYSTTDLIPGDRIVFSCSGVTDGELLRGVRFFGGGRRTSSLFMSVSTGQIRFIDTIHREDAGSPVHFH